MVKCPVWSNGFWSNVTVPRRQNRLRREQEKDTKRVTRKRPVLKEQNVPSDDSDFEDEKTKYRKAPSPVKISKSKAKTKTAKLKIKKERRKEGEHGSM